MKEQARRRIGGRRAAPRRADHLYGDHERRPPNAEWPFAQTHGTPARFTHTQKSVVRAGTGYADRFARVAAAASASLVGERERREENKKRPTARRGAARTLQLELAVAVAGEPKTKRSNLDWSTCTFSLLRHGTARRGAAWRP